MPSFYARTKNFLWRNRTPLLAIPTVIGGTYLVGSYILNKITEARQRLSDDRLAKENLRRRFAQNQEDCTYTVLALLPTATENVCGELEVERLTGELQARRAVRGGGKGEGASVTSSDFVTSEAPSHAVIGDGEKSSEGNEEGGIGASGFVHASQVEALPESAPDNPEGQQPPRQIKTKVQLWDEVKTTSLTRAITLLYTMTLLTLLTRIQLNLLGRRNYLSSVVSLAQAGQQIDLENRDEDAAQSYGDDFDTNRMYLTFSWWLLHRGWRSIRGKVERAVNEVFASMSPRDSVSYARFAEAMKQVRMRIEGATEAERRESKWLEYLLPEKTDEQQMLRESGIAPSTPAVTEADGHEPSFDISRSLRRLLDETSDIIESPTFAHVLTDMLDSGFELLVEDKVAREAFKIPPQTGRAQDTLPGGSWLQTERIEEVEEGEDGTLCTPVERAKQTTCRLATILAVITRQAHVIGSGGNLSSLMASTSSTWESPVAPAASSQLLKEANEYLRAIESVGDLEAFAAVIYSSNFELESLGESSDDDSAPGHVNLTLKEVEKSLVEVGKDVEGSLESAWNRAASTARSGTR